MVDIDLKKCWCQRYLETKKKKIYIYIYIEQGKKEIHYFIRVDAFRPLWAFSRPTNVLANITALHLFTLLTSNCMFIFLSVTSIAELPRKPIGKFVRDVMMAVLYRNYLKLSSWLKPFGVNVCNFVIQKSSLSFSNRVFPCCSSPSFSIVRWMWILHVY